MSVSPFKPQAPITFGSGLGTPASAPQANTSVASGLSIGAGGNAFKGGSQVITDPNINNANALASAILPTSSGGVAFHPSMAAGYSKPAQTSQSVVDNSGGTSNPNYNYNAGVPQSGAGGLAQYTYSSNPTSTGGNLTTNANGAPVGYSPSAGYSIDTSSAAPSNALGSTTLAGLQSSHNSYSDYVNALSQAQGYGPDYINALQGQYAAQTQGAQLGLNSSALNSNLYTGNNLPGDTMAYAQGATAKAQAQNTLQQSQNSIQQLGANQALNTAQLARTGNISAAQTQLQYSPEGITGQNALNQVNTLQQAHPDAGIIPYASSGMSPEEYQQYAMKQVLNAASFQAQYQNTFTTAGGGTGIYNKLNTSGLQQNSDGTISLVNDGAAITGAADKTSASTLTGQINSLTPAYNAANQDFTYLTNFMQSAGINQSNIPAINQVQQAIQAKALDPGALAEFKAGIASLRTNYAALLGSRGETPTQAGSDAQSLVPDTLSPAQLTQVQNALNVNGKNIIDANQSQLENILSKYGGTAGSTGLNTSTSSGGSIYDF